LYFSKIEQKKRIKWNETRSETHHWNFIFFKKPMKKESELKNLDNRKILTDGGGNPAPQNI
jgi:hypothetical protein